MICWATADRKADLVAGGVHMRWSLVLAIIEVYCSRHFSSKSRTDTRSIVLSAKSKD